MLILSLSWLLWCMANYWGGLHWWFNSAFHIHWKHSCCIIVICLNWLKQQTLLAFVSVKDYLQTTAWSWIHNRSVSLRAAFVLGFVVVLFSFFWVVGLSCIYHAHVFPRFPASCWRCGEVYTEGHISETLSLYSALKNVCIYCMCVFAVCGGGLPDPVS